MRKTSTRSVQTEDEQNIDITPMLDVVFIMLIFFIVTATFVDEIGIEVNRPENSQTRTENESDNILIRIGADNAVWFGDRRVDMRAVRPNITRLLAENPRAMVLIQTSPESKTETLVRVMDASRSAGIYRVSIVGEMTNG